MALSGLTRPALGVNGFALLALVAVHALAQPDPSALTPLYRQNLARAQKTFGPQSREARQAARDLGIYLSFHGSKREAYAVLRAVAESAVDFDRLAELAPPGEATYFLRRALQAEESALGPKNPRIAVRLNNLAVAVPPAQAEPLLRRALAINEESLGPAHPEAGVTLSNLADALAQLQRFREAEPLALRAVEILRISLGASNDRTRTAAANLAGIQRALGRSGSAPR